MAKDFGDAIETLGKAARETGDNIRASTRGDGPLSGVKGVAAGAGLLALAPFAAKGVGSLVKGTLAKPAKKAGKQAKDKAGEQVKNAMGGAGGAAGAAAKAGKGLIPRLGGDGGDDGDDGGGGKNDAQGTGKGRRMPIQQAIDVAVPIKTAYDQWTQFEEWPNFMHRLDRVSQEDEAHVSFKTKIWGISKEFDAEIVEQRPEERIKWRVTDGVTHTGVVTFHQLADRLTRIEVNLDVEPGSLLEKAGRGMRHAKRAVRADLARFKAFVEMEEDATGTWRGTIEDGEVKKRSRSGGGSSSKSRSSKSSGRSKSSSSRSRSSSGGAKSSSSRSSSSGAKSSGRSRSTSAKSSSRGGSSRSSSNGSRASSSGSRSSSGRKQAGSSRS
jgi:uncharacterized membrane protein